uniref:NADH-ubiquinone oxidoreductase chain 6 n=1 Tax=Allognosta vagans TaxID=2885619 RepID=A0A8K1NTH3_9DIPT|nr:NADH dehydrogenase subunit 6 [Allognosta vagans]
MMQTLLYSLTLISSMIFLQMNHPLAMGLMLLIQSLLTCLITGMMFNSFWFSYILFLIFLGGMMILFIYVTSLASNEMFSFSFKLFFYMFMLMIFTLIILFFMDKMFMLSIFNNDNMNKLIQFNFMLPNNSLTLIKLYNFPTNLISILLMNYLLLTLIMVVKITNSFYGPLRPMN